MKSSTTSSGETSAYSRQTASTSFSRRMLSMMTTLLRKKRCQNRLSQICSRVSGWYPLTMIIITHLTKPIWWILKVPKIPILTLRSRLITGGSSPILSVNLQGARLTSWPHIPHVKSCYSRLTWSSRMPRARLSQRKSLKNCPRYSIQTTEKM